MILGERIGQIEGRREVYRGMERRREERGRRGGGARQDHAEGSDNEQRAKTERQQRDARLSATACCEHCAKLQLSICCRHFHYPAAPLLSLTQHQACAAHFSFTITVLPVKSFRKGFGLTGTCEGVARETEQRCVCWGCPSVLCRGG